MKHTGLLWVALLAAITAGCSRNESTTTKAPEHRAGGAAAGTGVAAANDAKGDEHFVHEVALMNMAAIELSRMALRMGASPQIKVLAQKMVDDHGAAGDKLKSVVTGSQIEWPLQLDDKHRKTVDDLAKKQGAEFDRGYVEAMVHAHQDLVAKLEPRLDLKTLADWQAAAAGRTQSKALPDPKVEMRDVEIRPEKSDNATTMKINQWAADMYPVTQKHLDTARTLENAPKEHSGS
jgi:predicted outer membrane protein